MAKKIEMLNDQQEVVHPLTSSDCVIMENGKTLEEVMGDGIATPTVTHEGASFQVGVGDSNIEVVDGDVAGMTLEGQTYQNILPKPTTLIMETDEKEFKINDKIDNNIVLDDNVAEIATIKGQTYVNAVQEESASEYVAIDEELNGQSITTTGKPEGYVKNATLEGLTLVNTIQEPSGADATVLELDADIEAQYATIDNTVQGGIHGTKLVGQTLVNVDSYYDKTDKYFLQNNIDSISDDGYIQLTANGTWRNSFTKFNNMLKPNTQYLAIVEIKTNTLADGTYPFRLFTDGEYNGNITTPFISQAINIQNGVTGVFKYILTTRDDLSTCSINGRHYISNTVTSGIIVFRYIIIEYQEGMENWDIPFFRGMQSVEVPSVTTTGKNLFNKNKEITNDKRISTLNGFMYDEQGYSVIEYLKINPNTRYILTHDSRAYCAEYDKDKIFIRGFGWDNGKTITTHSNTRYIRLDFPTDRIDIVQIEEGSTATTYEPYKSSTLTTGKLPLTSDMIEQGSFFDSFELNTQTYEYIKVPSTNTDFYTNRIRSKATFKVHGGDKYIFNLNTDYAITLGFCKNGLYSAKNGSWITNGTTITIPSDCDEMFFAIKKTSDANIAPSEFSSVGLEIRHLVNLRKVGNVQDELDLETGKLTQRIGEITFVGDPYTEFWKINDYIVPDNDNLISYVIQNEMTNFVSPQFPTRKDIDAEGLFTTTPGNRRHLVLTIEKSKVPNGIYGYLRENPLTVYYNLATPIVKTIDLQVTDQDGNTIPHIQAQPTLTHVSTTSSNGLIPFVTIPSQLKYPTIIKPSTTYTVQLKQTTINSEFPLTINLGGTVMAVPSTKFTITTPSELTSQDAIFTGKNNVIGEVVITEGDTTGIEYDYFEGMNNVTFGGVLATGKNLLDKGIVVDEHNSHDYLWTKNYDSKPALNIKHNTTYTLSLSRFNGDGKVILWNGENKTREINIIISQKGLTFTTASNEDGFSFYAAVGENGNALSQTVQLEEGSTATSYEPYKSVTIKQDIDSIPLTSDMFEQGGYNGGSTSIVKGMSVQQFPISQRADRIKSKTLIKVKPNTTFSINDLRFSAITFDKNGGYNNIIDFCTSFTTDSNTYYLGINLSKTGNSNITPSSLDSLNLALQEVPQEIVLRSLPNGVKDTLNLTTGEYVQRIGEITFKNQSGWEIAGGNANLYYYNTNNIGNANIYVSSGVIPNLYCDKFEVTSYSRLQQSTSGVKISNRGKQGTHSIAVYNSDITNNVIDFRTWLMHNPFTIQYELATPIIHKVNLTNTTKLPSYASTTHYDTIVPSNSLVPNIKISSTVDYNVAIKPSTQYTIRANTTSAMSVDLGGSTGTLTNGKVTLTTPSTLAHNSLKLGNGKVKEVMVIEGSEIKDNVPFFNGMKNVQMGGIKLVNIARGISVGTNGKVTANTNKTQFTYTGDGMNWGYVNFDASLLKPNTVYTLYVNIITNNGTDSSGSIKYEVGTHLGQFSHNISSDYTGIYKKVITSVSEQDIVAGHLKLAFRPTTSGNQIVIQNPMIIEGDWTHLDEIPFIESEMIIEQPIIRSQGKNLFDNVIKYGAIDGSNGVISSSPTRHLTVKPLKLFKNVNYIFKINSSGNNCMIRELYFYGNQSCTTYIGRTGNKNTIINYTPNQDCYVRIVILKEVDSQEVKVEEGDYTIQIEEGSSETTYEPFKQHTLSSNRVIGYEEGVHYAGTTGIQYTNASYNSVLADVEGLSIAYVTNASSNFSFWDKDMVFISGKAFLDTSLSGDNKNGFIQVPSNAKYIRFASGNNSGSATNYTKATVTGELPLRSLPNGVCDSFNLVTGEYVQRVGEIVLDGSESWNKDTTSGGTKDNTAIFFTETNFNGFKPSPNVDYRDTMMLCDKIPIKARVYNLDEEGMMINQDGRIYIRINQSRLETVDMSGFKKFLSANNIKVECELATPIVRKIGLTAKGNYKEIELNGRNIWTDGNNGTNNIKCARYYVAGSNIATICPNVIENSPIIVDNVKERVYNTDAHGDYEYISFIGQGLYYQIYKDKLQQNTVAKFREWVSLNPLKIGYLSSNSASLYSNIQKPIFFNNVKVQFMNSNVDIQPSLTLQARSRNSYVMDMMKANTVYTSKFWHNGYDTVRTRIDNTYMDMSKNGTFTSPSTLGNKLLITATGVQELMIIEGDVTGKQLPYYKGIRSSFDNTDEIEIYNVGRNIFDMNKLTYSTNNVNVTYRDVNKIIFNTSETWAGLAYDMQLKPNTKYILSCIKNKTSIKQFYRLYNGSSYSSSGEGGGNTVTFTTNNTGKVRITYEDSIGNTTDNEVSNIMLEEASTATPYQPHQHNTTSLPIPTRLETVEVVKPIMEVGRISEVDGQEDNTDTGSRYSKDYIPVEPNMILTFMNGNAYRAENIRLYGINKNYISAKYTNGSGDLIIPKDCYFIRFYSGASNTNDMSVIKKQYKPIALNSLPNGVKDEIVIDPVSNKAKLIQRVGKVVFDGQDVWGTYTVHDNNVRIQTTLSNCVNRDTASQVYSVCDKLPSVPWNYSWLQDYNLITVNVSNIHLQLADTSLTKQQMLDWLKRNPITVYYELAEPVVTEISLKGYPYVYKDGSVQLNTEIPHTTKVKYNVNQEHLINGQNETIIRHDKQIDNLYDYIELYLEEEYRMELFRMQLELSL